MTQKKFAEGYYSEKRKYVYTFKLVWKQQGFAPNKYLNKSNDLLCKTNNAIFFLFDCRRVLVSILIVILKLANLWQRHLFVCNKLNLMQCEGK